MFIFAHLIAGLLIGKLTGQYVVSIIVSVAVDIDHVVPFIKHHVFNSWKHFEHTVFSRIDEFGDQRNYLHALYMWGLLSSIVYMQWPAVAFAFAVSYAVHLVLDAFDTSDFYPFYPWGFNVKGYVDYFSRSELYFTTVLLVLFITT